LQEKLITPKLEKSKLLQEMQEEDEQEKIDK